MSNLLTTALIAFILFLIALGLLAIGLLLTGFSRFRGNRCGRAPQKIRDEDCGEETSCELCRPAKEEEK